MRSAPAVPDQAALPLYGHTESEPGPAPEPREETGTEDGGKGEGGEDAPPAETASQPEDDENDEDEDEDEDDEEGREAYHLGGFHPVYIGDVFAGKYKVLNKIGYGIYSTVWLVEDTTKL